MKLMKASYRIDDMPDGEEALAKIERLGRIAYKSEGLIDDGMEECPRCSTGVPNGYCDVCANQGNVRVREPSSHKFVRKILKAERKARMIINAELYLQNAPITHSNQRRASELVNNIIDYMLNNPAHESVIEHCIATVVFVMSRGTSHEIVRHRAGIVFTQESTRFCDYMKGKFGGEISTIERMFWGNGVDSDMENKASAVWQQAMEGCERAYQELRGLGIAPEIARDVLPTALKTEIGTTANFREWRLLFSLRCAPAAHPDMRALMIPLRDEFRKSIPIIFD